MGDDFKYRENDDTNPSHYRSGDVETIDMIRTRLGVGLFIGFCIGNVLKYQDRAGMKPGSTAETCLDKAAWYLQMADSVVHADISDPRTGVLPAYREMVTGYINFDV
jgi:hypothetical protein